MRRRRFPVQFQSKFLFAVLALSTVCACAAGTPPPRTSPLAESGVVGGRIEMSIVPSAPLPPVLVSVAGSTLNTNASPLGDFVIANIPAGPLELRFTGGGIAAALPVGPLAAGETLTLVVRLAPSEAAIHSIARVRGNNALVEGPIEELAAPVPANILIVGGRTITVPEGIPVRDHNGGTPAALKAGVRVRVTGTVSGAGITAREIIVL